MLCDELGAELLGFGHSAMPTNTKLACWIVNGNQPLPKTGEPMINKMFLLDCLEWFIPLLNSERFIFSDSQSNHLTLSIESIKVDVSYHPQR